MEVARQKMKRNKKGIQGPMRAQIRLVIDIVHADSRTCLHIYD